MNEVDYGDGVDSSEAYSSIAVISALVFGFAVTTLVGVEGNRAQSGWYHVAFGFCMSLVCALSAYGLVVMSLSYYHVRRLRVVAPEQISSFLKQTFLYRHVARGTTWVAVALYLVGLAIYAHMIYDTGPAVALSVLLGVAASSVVAVWLRLTDFYLRASGKRT